MIDEFKENPHGMLVIDEFNAILRKAFDKRSHLSGTLELLSEIYDRPSEMKKELRIKEKLF